MPTPPACRPPPSGDGDDWLLNGEKWFCSGASISQLALVMAKTDPDAPRHRQFSTFLVELPDPGYRIVRDIPVFGEEIERRFEGEVTMGHAEVEIRDLVVPDGNVLGGLGEGFAMGQHRLGYGRLRHGMWSIAKAQAALDMATARALERTTFGKPLADRQGIQWMLADCAEKLYVTRLMILHIAYKMEKGLDIRQENSIAKNYIAHMLHEVIDTSIQIHGSLGYTHDLPLVEWLAGGPGQPHRRRSRRGPPLDHRAQRPQGVRDDGLHGRRHGGRHLLTPRDGDPRARRYLSQICSKYGTPSKNVANPPMRWSS